MESEIDLLRQENARLMAKITGLESEKAELLKQVAEEKAKHEAENAELKSRIEELEKGRTDTTDAIAELKAEVVKLRDDNEQTSLQSDILPEVTVVSKEMVSGNERETIEVVPIGTPSSTSSNIINLVSNVYEKEDVSDHTLAPSAKSSEEKETVAFLNEVDKKMISDRIRQRNREKKHQQKTEQGLIQEINSSMEEKQILSAVTEISANQVRPNSLAERNEERAVVPDIINLYETACGAEKKAIEANREETLRWCFYAREFKRMYKDFMISNKVGEKKAKGQVYDLIIKQLPNTKRKTLCRQTQKALRIDDLFEKIGMDKLHYIRTYSADTISKFTDPQIQRVIDHFTENPDMGFIDDPEDGKQDDDQSNSSEAQEESLDSAEVSESTAPIPLTHDSNSPDDYKEVSPNNSLEAVDDYYKMILEDCAKDCVYSDSASQSVKETNKEKMPDDSPKAVVTPIPQASRTNPTYDRAYFRNKILDQYPNLIKCEQREIEITA